MLRIIVIEGTGAVFQSCCLLKLGRTWWQGKREAWYHGRRRDRILNAYAKRWIRSIKEEALSQPILFAERALWYALTEYVTHFHEERPHQGKGNVVLMPSPYPYTEWQGPIRCRERLDGLLRYYSQGRYEVCPQRGQTDDC